MPYKQTAEQKEYQAGYNTRPDVLERRRDQVYKRRFGISLDDYNALLEKQNGVCAICKNTETETGNGGDIKRLSVDHCHTTGIVRGLLCASCNNLLFRAKDNTVLLRTAAVYLEVANTGFKTHVASGLSAEEFLDEIMKL